VGKFKRKRERAKSDGIKTRKSEFSVAKEIFLHMLLAL
jgi:hypothetical protein